MPLHANNQLLIHHLQALPELDSRFSGITIVNYDSVSGAREGVTSLVFKAFDKVEGKFVALKFYDLDTRFASDVYRIECFNRESTILGELVGVERCVQQVKSVSHYALPVPIAGAGGAVATLPCRYFALEWLDEKVAHYFYEQDQFDPLEKLLVFNEIMLSVQALHRKGVFHRDLKPDNLRAYSLDNARRIVVIDLGTAAHFTSTRLPTPAYPASSVGAPAYAGPEALCGLASSRQLAPFCDIYALGCMLFQLFHFDLFAKAVRDRNSDLDLRLVAMSSLIPPFPAADQDRVDRWNQGLRSFGVGVNPVDIDSPGSSVPPGIAPILQELLSALTHIDYRRRPTLETTRRKLWTAITVLRNDTLYRRKLAERLERRRRRLEKLSRRLRRIASAQALEKQ